MKITLDIRKTVDENASGYFEQAKKERKKIEGAKKIIAEYQGRLAAARKESEEKGIQRKSQVPKRKAEWYEKFRWFISSDGFLVLGGRDATTNELIIKKYSEQNDLVFHTDMAGSPFVVVKRDGKGEIPKTTCEEAAQFTASFSKGWKNGMSTLPVFSCRPDQVTKTPNPGEFLPKGAFVIRGELTYYSPRMEYAVGAYNNTIMGGPPTAVRKHCLKVVLISQGDSKVSDVAKVISKDFGADTDEVMRTLPAGCKIKKN